MSTTFTPYLAVFDHEKLFMLTPSHVQRNRPKFILVSFNMTPLQLCLKSVGKFNINRTCQLLHDHLVFERAKFFCVSFFSDTFISGQACLLCCIGCARPPELPTHRISCCSLRRQKKSLSPIAYVNVAENDCHVRKTLEQGHKIQRSQCCMLRSKLLAEPVRCSLISSTLISSSHKPPSPFGIFPPSPYEIGRTFDEMWIALEKSTESRAKYGCKRTRYFRDHSRLGY